MLFRCTNSLALIQVRDQITTSIIVNKTIAQRFVRKAAFSRAAVFTQLFDRTSELHFSFGRPGRVVATGMRGSPVLSASGMGRVNKMI